MAHDDTDAPEPFSCACAWPDTDAWKAAADLGGWDREAPGRPAGWRPL